MFSPAKERSLGDQIARLLVGVALFFVVISQALTMQRIGNGVWPTVDPFGEIGAFRVAEHSATHGFLSNVFLPRITYGRQCPDSGWADAATLSRGGGYTHYRRCRSSLQVVSRSRRIYPVGIIYRKLATFSETLRWVGAV